MDVTIIERVGEVLRAAAACAVMPRFAALQPADIVMKAADDPVTIADREAEGLIARDLRYLVPAARVVGEEACAADPGLLANLGEGLVWIIDPVDGTANFAAGRPPFAMMIALLQQGETVASWILDPLTDRLTTATRGGGAWRDAQRLNASAARVATSDLVGIVSEAFLPPGGRGIIDRLRGGVGETQPTARCAGHEYPRVATGERHFALYWRTLIWDHAPGALILTEAGGAAVRLDGSAYHPTSAGTGLLLSHTPEVSSQLLAVIAGATERRGDRAR